MDVVEDMLPTSLQRETTEPSGLEQDVQQQIIENIIESVPAPSDAGDTGNG